MATTIPISEDSLAQANGQTDRSHSSDLHRMISDWRDGRLWHKSAPVALRSVRGDLDLPAVWEEWRKHLAERKPPVDFSSHCLGDISPLDWGTPAEEATFAWRAEFDRQLAEPSERATIELKSMLAELTHELQDISANDPLTATVAHRAVIIAYRLPQLAAHLEATEWWRLAMVLSDLIEAQAIATDDGDAEETLVATYLGGELPFVMSVQLSELAPFRGLRGAARKFIGEGLLAATDGEGLIDAPLLPLLPALFASWTRCRAIGEGLKKNCWSRSAENQFEWLVRQTIRLTRSDGKPMLNARKFAHWPAGALDTALDLAGDDGDKVAADAHLGKILGMSRGDLDEDDLPDTSVESEWSSLAMLSDGWDKKANRVLVDYSQDKLQIEIESQGRTLFSGECSTETSLAGKTLVPVGEWDQQCWFSDEDCDFLDLVIELTGDARLERQLLLAKEDGFLLLHDILHAPEGQTAEWRHRVGLPFFTGIEFSPEKETRDGLLVDAKGSTRAAVLPLALAEWRIESRFGELEGKNSELQLAQYATGSRLSVPLWFDLRPRRAAKKRTWRKLTVAESLDVTPDDVAVGYRVQSGDSQWLHYRSLAPPGNRTLLGQNTSSELLIGRFLRTGELDDLLEVDPA